MYKFKRSCVLAVALSALLCVTGCDNNKTMREAFLDKNGEYKPVILMDSSGNKYVAEHHIGSNYSLRPID